MSKSPAKKVQQRRPEKEFDEEVIQIDRVTRVVAGGRRFRFRVMVAIGNKQGKVGVGTGKAGEIVGAIAKALAQAKKNMVEIPIVNDTIPHEIQLKYKSAKILLMPAGEGTGIIAGGALRKVIELAGIKNILSKTLGTSNKISNAKATVLALSSLSLEGGKIKFEKKVFPAKKEGVSEERQGGERGQEGRRPAPRTGAPKRPVEKKAEPKVQTEEAKVAKK